jgi:hypothetical protein
MKRLVFVLTVASFASAQPQLRHSVTFGLGSAIGNPRACCEKDTAVSLAATYGYRLFRHFQIEAGMTTALHPTPELQGANFTIQPTDRFIWVPFGLRGILPLRSGRIELSAAGGGLYENYFTGEYPLVCRTAVTERLGYYFGVGALLGS